MPRLATKRGREKIEREKKGVGKRDEKAGQEKGETAVREIALSKGKGENVDE